MNTPPKLNAMWKTKHIQYGLYAHLPQYFPDYRFRQKRSNRFEAAALATHNYRIMHGQNHTGRHCHQPGHRTRGRVSKRAGERRLGAPHVWAEGPRAGTLNASLRFISGKPWDGRVTLTLPGSGWGQVTPLAGGGRILTPGPPLCPLCQAAATAGHQLQLIHCRIKDYTRKTLTQGRWKLRQKMKPTFTNPRLILAKKLSSGTRVFSQLHLLKKRVLWKVYQMKKEIMKTEKLTVFLRLLRT